VRGLYRGVGATALRDVGYGAYFFAYEATCRWFLASSGGLKGTVGGGEDPAVRMLEEAGSLGWGALMVAGGVAGVGEWIAFWGCLSGTWLICWGCSWVGVHVPHGRREDEDTS
jgi:solute carrier family 25 carnitine/acylcarnitine transporter 20/29